MTVHLEEYLNNDCGLCSTISFCENKTGYNHHYNDMSNAKRTYSRAILQRSFHPCRTIL